MNLISFRFVELFGASGPTGLPNTGVLISLNRRLAGHAVLTYEEHRAHMIEMELKPEFRGIGLLQDIYPLLALKVAPRLLCGIRGGAVNPAYEVTWKKLMATGLAGFELDYYYIKASPP